MVPLYHLACSSHPVIRTIVAIKLANFEPVFTPLHSDWFVSIKCTLSGDMIIMQSLDLAIKACERVKKNVVCLMVACYELNN